jgi:hypothetical protein
MLVPFISSHPLGAPPRRTADLMPMALATLGVRSPPIEHPWLLDG